MKFKQIGYETDHPDSGDQPIGETAPIGGSLEMNDQIRIHDTCQCIICRLDRSQTLWELIGIRKRDLAGFLALIITLVKILDLFLGLIH